MQTSPSIIVEAAQAKMTGQTTLSRSVAAAGQGYLVDPGGATPALTRRKACHDQVYLCFQSSSIVSVLFQGHLWRGLYMIFV
jgi:hypothetical protein